MQDDDSVEWVNRINPSLCSFVKNSGFSLTVPNTDSKERRRIHVPKRNNAAMAKRCCPTCGQTLPTIKIESISLPLLSKRSKSGDYLAISYTMQGWQIFWATLEDGLGHCIGGSNSHGPKVLKDKLDHAAGLLAKNAKDKEGLDSIDFWAVELAAHELFSASKDARRLKSREWSWDYEEDAKDALRKLKVLGDRLMVEAVSAAIAAYEEATKSE